MFNPSAKIICDSVNPCGDRLTTFVLTYHRMVHSEFNTHRMLSRNASSSRAIPVEKMIKLVEEQEVYPLHWGKNQKGMVATEELSEHDQELAKYIWRDARFMAIAQAKKLVEIGVHKQVVNRLLEPFSTITVIATGTEWGNLFEQRCHPDAQPEFKVLADLMREAYNTSLPDHLAAGEWHTPFLDGLEKSDWKHTYIGIQNSIKIATGRCARVSYLNHDGKRDIQADIALHDRLLNSKPAHLSPFEHCAKALPSSDRCANFTGWESYRHILEEQKC